jgi:short-subunit dehydrogenase
MKYSHVKGMTALVTGASSGIGVAFARHLAAGGANLVLVARRAAQLDALADELRKTHDVRVTTIAIDLSDPAAPQQIFDKTEGAGERVDVVVNNAGSGIFGEFVDIPWAETARQIQLNVVSLTELTWRFARAMRGRDRGWVLNVASIGAYTPTPTFATYAAGKAYVRDFTEALAFELRHTAVRVCCLCPGGTTTEFHQVAGQTMPGIFRLFFMSADRCADIGLAALFGGRRNVVSGIYNKVSMLLLRLVPRRLMVRIAAATMGQPPPREPAALPAPK